MSEPYSIQDLSEKTGLPRRTIHFYIQQGLLPSPQGSGLGARYDENHLLRLQLIPVFRSEGLRLDQIRERFEDMDVPTLNEYFQRTKANPPIQVQSDSIPRGMHFFHYSFQGGVTMIVPDLVNQELRDKINRLLIEADRIFNQTNRH